jgi:hypothetical protein
MRHEDNGVAGSAVEWAVPHPNLFGQTPVQAKKK